MVTAPDAVSATSSPRHAMLSPRSTSSVSEVDSFSDSGLSDDALSGSWLDVDGDSLQDFGESGSSACSQPSDDGATEENRTPYAESKPPLFGQIQDVATPQAASILGSSYLDPDGSATVLSLNSSIGTIGSSAYRLVPASDNGLVLPDPLSDSYSSSTHVAKTEPKPAPSRLQSFLADSADTPGVDESFLRASGAPGDVQDDNGDGQSSRADGEYSLLNSRTSDELAKSIKASTEFFGDAEDIVIDDTPKQVARGITGRDLTRKWALRTALFALASFISLATITSFVPGGPCVVESQSTAEAVRHLTNTHTHSVLSTVWEHVSSSAPPDPTAPPSDLQIVKNALSTFYFGVIKVEEAVTAAAVETPKRPVSWKRHRARVETAALIVPQPNALDSDAIKATWRAKLRRAACGATGFEVQVTSATSSAIAVAQTSSCGAALRQSVQPALKRAAQMTLVLRDYAQSAAWHALMAMRHDAGRTFAAWRRAAVTSIHRAARGAALARSMLANVRVRSSRAPAPAQITAEALEAIARARASLDTLSAYVESTSRKARNGLDNVLEDCGLRASPKGQGKVIKRTRMSRVLEMAHHAALQAVL